MVSEEAPPPAAAPEPELPMSEPLVESNAEPVAPVAPAPTLVDPYSDAPVTVPNPDDLSAGEEGADAVDAR